MTARSSTAPSRIDWPTVHATVLEIFARGRQRPGPHAWDGFLAEDVELVQPLLRRPRTWWPWWPDRRLSLRDVRRGGLSRRWG